MRWQRVADVNLNRLAESLKIIEDATRFIFENRLMLKKIRLLRYSLKKIRLKSLIKDLVQYRDSIADPGRSGDFDHPSLGNPQDMIMANTNRAKESCRALEEIFKIEDHSLSRYFKSIRFQLYDIEKDFFIYFRKEFDPSIYAIIDEKYIKMARLEEIINLQVKNGVTMMQLRIKTWTDRRFLNSARIIQDSLINTQVKLIINNRPDIAMMCGADGVHLGQNDMPLKFARRLLGERYIIGISAHTVNQAIAAQKQGADYIGVGALYPSRTKKDSWRCSLGMLRKICRAVKIPVIGIGGINNLNHSKVIDCGAAGIAVCEYLFAGDLRKNLHRLTQKRE